MNFALRDAIVAMKALQQASSVQNAANAAALASSSSSTSTSSASSSMRNSKTETGISMSTSSPSSSMRRDSAPPMPVVASAQAHLVSAMSILAGCEDIPNLKVREMDSSEIETATACLKTAFVESDDPFVKSIFGLKSDGAVQWFFRVIAEYCKKKGRLWIALLDSKIIAVALWQAPSSQGARVSKLDLVKHGMLLAPFVLGISTSLKLSYALTETENRHVIIMGNTRHWSLYSIGVAKAFRCRGIGRRLCAPIIALAGQGLFIFILFL